MTTNATDLGTLLQAHPVVHVVGLSPNPARDSHRVAVSLISRGFEVVPINPTVDEVLGRRAYPNLQAAAASGPVRLVDVFRAGEALPGLVDEVLALGSVDAVWLQLDVHHGPSEERLRAAGVTVVADRCIKVEAAAHDVRHSVDGEGADTGCGA